MIFVPLLTELSRACYGPVFCAMVISIWFEKSAEEVTVRVVRACILSLRAQRSVPWVTLAKRHSYESTSRSSKRRDIVSLSPDSDFLPLKRERERKKTRRHFGFHNCCCARCEENNSFPQFNNFILSPVHNTDNSDIYITNIIM